MLLQYNNFNTRGGDNYVYFGVRCLRTVLVFSVQHQS